MTAPIVDNRDLQFLKKYEVEQPKPNCKFFPVSNVHKILPTGTVIESPERIKLREDLKIKQALDQIGNLELEDEDKLTPGYSRQANNKAWKSSTQQNDQI